MSAAPDYLAPVSGWRTWRIDESGPEARLASLIRPAAWPVGEPLIAACSWAGLAHHPPGPGCRCGLHAAPRRRPRPPTTPTCRPAAGTRWPSASSALWGKVVEGEAGWRASRAYPEVLYVILRSRAPGALRGAWPGTSPPTASRRRSSTAPAGACSTPSARRRPPPAGSGRCRGRGRRIAAWRSTGGTATTRRIAAALAPAAEVLLDAVRRRPGPAPAGRRLRHGQRRPRRGRPRGAAATGVDASAPLVALARERAAARGGGGALPGRRRRAPARAGRGLRRHGQRFGVIFAPDPARARPRWLRVTRPGGAVALTRGSPPGADLRGRPRSSGRRSRPATGGRRRAGTTPAGSPRLLAAAGGARPLRSRSPRSPSGGVARGLAGRARGPPPGLALGPADAAGEASGARCGAACWPRSRSSNEDPAAFRATSGYLVAVAGR